MRCCSLAPHVGSVNRARAEGGKTPVRHWLRPFLPECVTKQQGRGTEKLSGPCRLWCLCAQPGNIMAREKSARTASVLSAHSQGGRQTGFYLAGSTALLPRVVLLQLGRTDGLWLAPVPFTSGAGRPDMTGMASGWRWRRPPPAHVQIRERQRSSPRTDGAVLVTRWPQARADTQRGERRRSPKAHAPVQLPSPPFLQGGLGRRLRQDLLLPCPFDSHATPHIHPSEESGLCYVSIHS